MNSKLIETVVLLAISVIVIAGAGGQMISNTISNKPKDKTFVKLIGERIGNRFVIRHAGGINIDGAVLHINDTCVLLPPMKIGDSFSFIYVSNVSITVYDVFGTFLFWTKT
jgi:hypothetical protein